MLSHKVAIMLHYDVRLSSQSALFHVLVWLKVVSSQYFSEMDDEYNLILEVFMSGPSLETEVCLITLIQIYLLLALSLIIYIYPSLLFHLK